MLEVGKTDHKKKSQSSSFCLGSFPWSKSFKRFCSVQRLGSDLESEKLRFRRLPTLEGALRRREVQAAARPSATSWETCALT